MFSSFGYLNGIVDEKMDAGYYKITIDRENNLQTKNIMMYLELKELSGFGVNFTVVSYCYFYTAFFLMLSIITISFIHRLKYKKEAIQKH